MGGRAGDDLHHAIALQLGEGSHHVALDLLEIKIPRTGETFVIEPGQSVEMRIGGGSLDFEAGKFDPAIEVAFGPRFQQRIPQHGAKRWRESQGQRERHAIDHQAAEQAQERDVSFHHRLEEPVLFVEFLVLGMPDEGKVGVEEKRQLRTTN